MRSLGFDDLQTLSCEIDSLKGLLELLYTYTMNDERFKFINSVVYGLQVYAEEMDTTMRRYEESLVKGAAS